MYATIRIYTGADQLADALVERSDDVKALITGIDGFAAYYVVRTADGAATVSVYADEAGADESNSAAAAWVKENLPDLNVSPPQIYAGDVGINF